MRAARPRLRWPRATEATTRRGRSASRGHQPYVFEELWQQLAADDRVVCQAQITRAGHIPRGFVRRVHEVIFSTPRVPIGCKLQERLGCCVPTLEPREMHRVEDAEEVSAQRSALKDRRCLDFACWDGHDDRPIPRRTAPWFLRDAEIGDGPRAGDRQRRGVLFLELAKDPR